MILRYLIYGWLVFNLGSIVYVGIKKNKDFYDFMLFRLVSFLFAIMLLRFL